MKERATEKKQRKRRHVHAQPLLMTKPKYHGGLASAADDKGVHARSQMHSRRKRDYKDVSENDLILYPTK